MLKVSPLIREAVVQVFDDPKPDNADDLALWTSRQDVKIKVRLVDRTTFRRWAYAHDRINADNKARIRLLRLTADPNDQPELFDDEKKYLTEEAAQETEAIMREVIGACVLELMGVEVEGLGPNDYRTHPMLAEVIEHAGLTTNVFAAALRAQRPEKKEVFC